MEMLFEKLTEKIIGAAYTVYNEMGFGYLEKVYEKCMMIELHKNKNLHIEQHRPIKVEYDGHDVVADMVINDQIIIELKSVRQLASVHEMQLVNYLNATGMDIGLLINFGEKKVDVRRKIRILPHVND